jgi:cell division protein FtsQ
MRKILTILVALLFIAYLGFSLFSLTKKPDVRIICKGIDVDVYDSLHYDLINEPMVMNMLKRRGMNPTDRPIDEIDTEDMERMFMSSSLIADAQCYKTIGGKIKIKLESRVPILRVKNSIGQDYYLDSHGEILNSASIVVNLPVATGNISKEFAQKELMYLIGVINESDFWKSQIEQIWVSSEEEITLVPRVGGHLLLIGDAVDVENKLDRLYRFYKKGLDVIGWNKYSSISVAYEKQVVCKRKQ